jgi:protein arginine N-methyltransferase 3
MAEAYPRSDSESVSSSDNEEDWLNKPCEEDEDDQEQVSVVSLLDEKVFPDAPAMLAYCKDKFGFDFLAVRDRLGLDFLGCVRLINLGESSHIHICIPALR